MSVTITAAVVRHARALIADAEHFIQGQDAVDRDGFSVPVTEPDACRWCAVGAVARTLDTWRTGTVAYALKEVALRAGFAPFAGVASINDAPNGHARVLAFLDRLADALEREEATDA